MKNNYQFLRDILCRNTYGKYSKGRKVTNVEFVEEDVVLVTTNDSRIRLIRIGINEQNPTILKYKGHLNDTLIIKAHYQ